MSGGISRRGFLASVMIWSIFDSEALVTYPQKTIDMRRASEVGEYAIGFSSEDSSDGLGHAFVVWYYSDPEGQRTVRRAAGFYPVANDHTKAYDMILGINGEVVDDSKQKSSRELTVRLNKDVFDHAMSIEDQYKNGKTYHLGFNDCTTFVAAVASQVRGLSIPSRALHLYPADFIKALFNANGDQGKL